MRDTLRELTLDECERVSGGWDTAGGVGTAVTNGGLSSPYALTLVFTITLGNGVGGGTYTAPAHT